MLELSKVKFVNFASWVSMFTVKPGILFDRRVSLQNNRSIAIKSLGRELKRHGYVHPLVVILYFGPRQIPTTERF